MSKEAYIQAHEALVEEYMDAHPDVDWETAYDLTADAAHDRMRDVYADRADHARQLRKEAGQ
jgi:hypothetical protein